MSVTGTDKVLRNLRLVNVRAPDVFAGALVRQAENMMTRSKTEFVPVDQGDLRNTGHVQPPVVEGSETSVTLGFGGPAASYAIPQHENLDFKHQVGEAKYLERPVLEASATLAKDLANDPEVKDLFR